MVKRNSRNIGKKVIIKGMNHLWNGEKGRIVGFWLDKEKGIPYIQVFVYSAGSVWPFSGKFLHYEKNERR
uniref:Uncharacterized protein n=1 Tax=viral metagenome TaxID=1070528 RepID=A0A6M3LC58_9ZZZZ